MATRNSTARSRLRKRKAPDTPPQTTTNHDSITYNEPQLKRRRITHYRRQSARIRSSTANKVEKSQSVEPRNFDKQPLQQEQKRYEDDNDMDDDDDVHDSSESSSPEQSVGAEHHVFRSSYHHPTRSQPSTPVRPKPSSTTQQEPHHSQSAKKSRTSRSTPQHRSTTTNNRTARALYQQPTMTVCNEQQECTPPPPPQLCASDRKHTPNLHQSQDSIDFSPSPSPSASPKRTTTREDNEIVDDVLAFEAGIDMSALSSYASPPKLYRTHTQCQPLPQSQSQSYNAAVTIPINATPLRNVRPVSMRHDTIEGGSNIRSNDYHNHSSSNNLNDYVDILTSISKNSDRLAAQMRPWSSDVYEMLMFILLGVLIGVIVACSVMNAQQQHQSSVIDPSATRATNMDIASICACDVKKNQSSLLCHPCIQQYRELERMYEGCTAQTERLLDAEKHRTQQHALMVTEKCEQMQQGISAKYDQCRAENAALRDANDGECRVLKYELNALKHELGECHVEWGTCKQSGRQKDKLDEMRVEEIEKQKRKFSLCNEQLKRLKNEAKESKK